MSPRHDDEASTRHRFFHAMVVMGGSLALGCGGAVSEDPDGGGSAGAAVTGTGGSGSGGAPAATGGRAPLITGGVVGTGGQPTMTTGGTVDPGACPPAQLACALTGAECRGNGYALPNSCPCDSRRPASAADCAADEAFVCRNATMTHEFAPLPGSVGFDCKCVPRQPSCASACDLAFGFFGTACRADAEDLSSILCGCAVVVLR